MKEIQAILWKEWREIFFHQKLMSKIRSLFLIVFAGVLMPLNKGIEWFSTPFIYGIGIIGPLLMVMTVICDLFAGERERHTLETLLASNLSNKGFILGKVTFAVTYATSITILLLFLNVVSINVIFHNKSFIIFSVRTGLILFVINFLLALYGAVIGMMISIKSSTVKQAQLALTIIIIMIGIIPSAIINHFAPKLLPWISKGYTFFGKDRTILLASVFLVFLGFVVLLITTNQFKRSSSFNNIN